MIHRTLALGAARVVCTDRHGGVSAPPYASLNLADHVGDDTSAVVENRRRVAGALSWAPDDPGDWVWLHQVHGARVVTLDAPPPVPPEADAVVTTTAELPLVVLTADCAPIVLVDDAALAVVHAGWPGLEAGIVRDAVDALRAAGAGPVRAALGPCVHPDRYEFGADLLARLVARLGPAVAARTVEGRPALDVPAAVRAELRAVGVHDLVEVGVDTIATGDLYSHRRDGTTGRHALVAALRS